MSTCGKCGAHPPDDNTKHYAVRVDGQWIARFTYPAAQVDKAWASSDGLQLAPSCKAIVGEVPYLWSDDSSARFVAHGLGGEHVWICDRCVPKNPKKKRKAGRHGEDETGS